MCVTLISDGKISLKNFDSPFVEFGRRIDGSEMVWDLFVIANLLSPLIALTLHSVS